MPSERLEPGCHPHVFAPYPTSTSGYRLKLQYTYQHGLPQQVKDADPNASTIFWQATAMNPRGQVTQEVLGNGIVANRNYDAVTGWINYIQCGVGGGACSQSQSYQFDKVGNLTQRQNANLNLTENFYYDSLNRLDYSTLNGVENLNPSYDAAGNITARSDVNNGAVWQYDTAHPHRLLQAGNTTYVYDNNGAGNGNVTSRNGNEIQWTSYNYPKLITGPGETINLSYDANRQRYAQEYIRNGVTETTAYVGGLMEKVSVNGVDDYRYQIYGGGQLVAIMSRTTAGANNTRYVLNDFQGGVAKLTDSSGNSIVSESFTAFGERRNPATWSGQPTYGDLTTINAISRDGYTGHTALGNLGLNHMNGRVQDAVTGRFLSADPYITEPGNTQNYNRYSYVYNNPLSYTDPSGFGVNECTMVNQDYNRCMDSFWKQTFGQMNGYDAQRYGNPQATFYTSAGTYYGGFGWSVGSAGAQLGLSFSNGRYSYSSITLNSGTSSAIQMSWSQYAKVCPSGCTSDFGLLELGTTIYNGFLEYLNTSWNQLIYGDWPGNSALDSLAAFPLVGAIEGNAARGVANAVPRTLARVVPGKVVPTTLGRSGASDVFVTAADDIAGLNAAQIAERLSIPRSSSFTVIEFATPTQGLASPILRSNPGFLGGGLTGGGAREFVLPNGPIPAGSIFRTVGP